MSIEPELIQLIHDRYGLVIHVDQAGALSRTIVEACQEFQCQPEEYLQKLKKCPSNSPLLTFLIAGITVGESYFFRDQHQMHLLKSVLLPRLIEQKKREGSRSLRVWSSGCSTGEEIYSIAIMLSELIENVEQWDLQLLGSDINRPALEKAKAGKFGEWSMRSISELHKRRYFTKLNKQYELSPDIRKLVKFSYINLMENSYPSVVNGTTDQDLILCRNVLIYFDDEVISQIINKLSSCLSRSGYFIFGASDPIVTTANNLVFHHEEDAIYFTLGG